MELNQVYRYVDPYSLLVVTPKKLIRVFCPFRVEANQDFSLYKAGVQLQVVKVELSQDHRLVYIINRQGFPYHLFRIIL